MGLEPKNKGHVNFYECCDLTKKVYLKYIVSGIQLWNCNDVSVSSFCIDQRKVWPSWTSCTHEKKGRLHKENVYREGVKLQTMAVLFTNTKICQYIEVLFLYSLCNERLLNLVWRPLMRVFFFLKSILILQFLHCIQHWFTPPYSHWKLHWFSFPQEINLGLLLM